MKPRRKKLPTTVLERAKAAAGAVAPKKPAPSAPARSPKAQTRAKVVAALKKLHPMD